MTRLKPWPIIVGILVDAFGTIVLVLLSLLVIFGTQIFRSAPVGDESFSAPQVVVVEMLGLSVTVLGGFVAARMANTLCIQHGASVGIAAVFVWLLVEWVSPSESILVWYDVLSLIAVIPAGALGGYLAEMWANRPLRPTSGEQRSENNTGSRSAARG